MVKNRSLKCSLRTPCFSIFSIGLNGILIDVSQSTPRHCQEESPGGDLRRVLEVWRSYLCFADEVLASGLSLPTRILPTFTESCRVHNEINDFLFFLCDHTSTIESSGAEN